MSDKKKEKSLLEACFLHEKNIEDLISIMTASIGTDVALKLQLLKEFKVEKILVESFILEFGEGSLDLEEIRLIFGEYQEDTKVLKMAGEEVVSASRTGLQVKENANSDFTMSRKVLMAYLENVLGDTPTDKDKGQK